VTAAHGFGGRVGAVVRNRWFRFALAALLIALAVVAAMLAHDVRSWRGSLRDEAIRYAVSPTAQTRSTAPTILPSGVSGRLLNVAPDRRRIRALQLFALAEALDTTQGILPGGERLLQGTENALSREAQDPNPARASQAYQLLSAVLFKDSKSALVPDLAAYAASISAMQNAVRADSRDPRAAANLELLLRQYEADSRQGSERQANNQGSQRRGKTIGRGKGIPPAKTPEGDY
jgi:hypothetical protein